MIKSDDVSGPDVERYSSSAQTAVRPRRARRPPRTPHVEVRQDAVHTGRFRYRKAALDSHRQRKRSNYRPNFRFRLVRPTALTAITLIAAVVLFGLVTRVPMYVTVPAQAVGSPPAGLPAGGYVITVQPANVKVPFSQGQEVRLLLGSTTTVDTHVVRVVTNATSEEVHEVYGLSYPGISRSRTWNLVLVPWDPAAGPLPDPTTTIRISAQIGEQSVATFVFDSVGPNPSSDGNPST